MRAEELEEKLRAKDSQIEKLEEQLSSFSDQMRTGNFKDSDRCRELELKIINLEQQL